jgi:hypothetical protein
MEGVSLMEGEVCSEVAEKMEEVNVRDWLEEGDQEERRDRK